MDLPSFIRPLHLTIVHFQFMATAPSGLLSVKAFQELLQDYTTLTYGTEQMPDAWMNVSAEKVSVLR